jgi:murein DD-endopeptidase MepM/ murein hydrolase activator NlpD
MRRSLPISVLLALLAAVPAAAAGDGSAQTPSYGGAGYGELQVPQRAADPKPDRAAGKPKAAPVKPKPAKPQATGSGGRPVLASFSIASPRLYLFGRAARVSFRIDDRSPAVQVKLRVANATTGALVRTIDLGSRATGVDHVYLLTGREDGELPGARYRVRVMASDGAGKPLARRAGASAVDELAVYGHRFPLRGNFSYGDPGSRFGAPRSGHTHQGQDVPAPEGTPVVAPRGGRITNVAYQGEGAGHYIVLDGAGEKRDFVFMHLQTGSIRVRPGQWVRTGKRIASVGNTGASFGAHLHFEIWDGPWYAGGHPIDPYPFLHNWDRWS